MWEHMAASYSRASKAFSSLEVVFFECIPDQGSELLLPLGERGK
jgi:hypothetical protein